MFFDPLWFLLIGPPMLLAIWAQMKVKNTYTKYAAERNAQGMTGLEVAQHLLQATGLSRSVRVELTPGELTDHYDPSEKVLRLSQGVAYSPSVAALGIVAHEVGHAVQDQVSYAPMRLRGALVPVANLGTQLSFILFFLGLVVGYLQLAWLGVLLFAGAVLFTLVTLPVEFDASGRALGMLKRYGLVTASEYGGARAVLNAAALTYVAAFTTALAQLLYYVLHLVGASSSSSEE
ncbi:MAG TPA: zinc metallopeptidase [Chloroflexota bacterium]